jgi:AraC-like DNA-binding protein
MVLTDTFVQSPPLPPSVVISSNIARRGIMLDLEATLGSGDREKVLLRGGLAPWQARRVAEYVRENIGTSLRASELSKLVRLSYSHFNRAFKVSFRQTPTSYIMRQRVLLAQEKMLTTAQSLSQVALECGLCDQAHFSRMFRRIVGQSPKLWRIQFIPRPPVSRDLEISH